MSKITIYILVLINLALVGYSAHHFLVDGGYSWHHWLGKYDLMVVPMVLFAAALVSRKMILVNMSLVFLVIYGPVYYLHLGPTSSASFAPLQLILVVVDCVYVVIADYNLKCWKHLFWGLLAGVVLLLIYHRVMFGQSIDFKLPALRVFGKFTDYMAKFAAAHGG
jgi:hypothetical protein